MDYDYVENLVKESKDGIESSKEKLIEEFKPFIMNVCKRTFVHGYEFQDIENECYKILLHCIELYDLDKHRFVAYATNGIKNSINYIIRHNVQYNNINGTSAQILTSEIEESLISGDMSTEDILCTKCDHEQLNYAIHKLDEKESELINSIYYKGLSVRKYAQLKNLSYSTIVKRKRSILDKLFTHMNIYNSSDNTPPKIY